MWITLIALGTIAAIALTYSALLDFTHKPRRYSALIVKSVYAVGFSILVALAIDIAIKVNNYSVYVHVFFDYGEMI